MWHESERPRKGLVGQNLHKDEKDRQYSYFLHSYLNASIYTQIYVHVCECADRHPDIYKDTQTRTRERTHTHKYMCIYMYMYICMYTCIYGCLNYIFFSSSFYLQGARRCPGRATTRVRWEAEPGRKCRAREGIRRQITGFFSLITSALFVLQFLSVFIFPFIRFFSFA